MDQPVTQGKVKIMLVGYLLVYPNQGENEYRQTPISLARQTFLLSSKEPLAFVRIKVSHNSPIFQIKLSQMHNQAPRRRMEEW